MYEVLQFLKNASLSSSFGAFSSLLKAKNRSRRPQCSVKKVLFNILQNSQEKICAIVTILKKRLWHSCFALNFAKFLRTFVYITLQSAASVKSYKIICRLLTWSKQMSKKKRKVISSKYFLSDVKDSKQHTVTCWSNKRVRTFALWNTTVVFTNTSICAWIWVAWFWN